MEPATNDMKTAEPEEDADLEDVTLEAPSCVAGEACESCQ